MNDNLDTLVARIKQGFLQKTDERNHLFEREIRFSLIQVRDKFAQSVKAVIYPTHLHLPAIHVCLASLELHEIERMSVENVLQADHRL